MGGRPPQGHTGELGPWHRALFEAGGADCHHLPGGCGPESECEYEIFRHLTYRAHLLGHDGRNPQTVVDIVSQHMGPRRGGGHPVGPNGYGGGRGGEGFGQHGGRHGGHRGGGRWGGGTRHA